MAAVVSPLLSPFHCPQKLPSLEPLLTGVAAIDQVTGGLSRAALTEIHGPASSGRSSLVQSILRTTLDNGYYAVWIDAPDTFDPESAESAGVRLSQLLWVRCRQQAEHALQAADLLLRAGGFSLVVLDLAGIPIRVTSRIPAASWFRLRQGAEQSGASLLVTGDSPHTGSCAKLQLAVRRERTLWSERLLRGSLVSASNAKRGRPQPVSFSATL